MKDTLPKKYCRARKFVKSLYTRTNIVDYSNMMVYKALMGGFLRKKSTHFSCLWLVICCSGSILVFFLTLNTSCVAPNHIWCLLFLVFSVGNYATLHTGENCTSVEKKRVYLPNIQFCVFEGLFIYNVILFWPLLDPHPPLCHTVS